MGKIIGKIMSLFSKCDIELVIVRHVSNVFNWICTNWWILFGNWKYL